MNRANRHGASGRDQFARQGDEVQTPSLRFGQHDRRGIISKRGARAREGNLANAARLYPPLQRTGGAVVRVITTGASKAQLYEQPTVQCGTINGVVSRFLDKALPLSTHPEISLLLVRLKQLGSIQNNQHHN